METTCVYAEEKSAGSLSEGLAKTDNEISTASSYF